MEQLPVSGYQIPGSIFGNAEYLSEIPKFKARQTGTR
jgi:hypothetical protein